MLIGRDALDRYRGLAGDELEVIAGRDVNDRAADALDAGIALAICRIYPAALMTIGRPTAAGTGRQKPYVHLRRARSADWRATFR